MPGWLSMPNLTLYHTSGCHLCEQAFELTQQLGIQVTLMDIVESQQLVDAYGVRIPVIQRADGKELGWPFDAESLQQFINA